MQLPARVQLFRPTRYWGVGVLLPEVEETTDFLLGDGLSGDDALRHDTGVVMVDLPFSIFVYIYKRISSLDLLSSGTHGELRVVKAWQFN